jgi:hypothetical protein
MADPVKYFVNFGTKINNRDQISQVLEGLLERESTYNGIIELNSNAQYINLKTGAAATVLNKANMVLNDKGIHILKLDIKVGCGRT